MNLTYSMNYSDIELFFENNIVHTSINKWNFKDSTFDDRFTNNFINMRRIDVRFMVQYDTTEDPHYKLITIYYFAPSTYKDFLKDIHSSLTPDYFDNTRWLEQMIDKKSCIELVFGN